MATRPHFEGPQEKQPGPSQPKPAEAAKLQPLTDEELQAVVKFFSLLDEWDRKQKVI